jgi:hypothetical protein
MKTDNVTATASEQEYMSRWLEHFTALLNQPAEIFTKAVYRER